MGDPSSAVPTGPTPAPPPAPPALGVNIDQVNGVVTAWRSESDGLAGLSFTAMSDVRGAGSDTLAAARKCADPAEQAVQSISDRLETMAGLIERFLKDVQQKDYDIAAEFSRLAGR